MIYPNFNEEKKLRKAGFSCVVGLDEVGRGPLAGPVVVGAVWIRPEKVEQFSNLGIKDSKKVSKKKREEIFECLKNNSDIKWAIGQCSEKEIDKINILEATKLAMIRATEALDCRADYLILDGNFTLNLNISQMAIVRGDMKVLSVALASIFAKVTRDRLMDQYDKKFPIYGFSKNMGYGTASHILAIKKHGPCPIHRKSFYPVSEC